MSLNTNITNLRELLDKVNALPEANSGNNNLPFSLTGNCINGNEFIFIGEDLNIGPGGMIYEYNIPENTNVIVVLKGDGENWMLGEVLTNSGTSFSSSDFGTSFIRDKNGDGTILRFELDSNASIVYLIPLYVPPEIISLE